jgi:hypothetical protein
MRYYFRLFVRTKSVDANDVWMCVCVFISANFSGAHSFKCILLHASAWLKKTHAA